MENENMENVWSENRSIHPLIQPLLSQAQSDYAAFESRIVPDADPKRIIGIKVPVLRKEARRLMKASSRNQLHSFMLDLPHDYHEENILHALLINEIRDFDETCIELERFLPFVKNWKICDLLTPKSFVSELKTEDGANRLQELMESWMDSQDLWKSRFAMRMLMNHFLKDRYSRSIVDHVCAVQSDEYYLQMMQAWYLATALIDHDEDVMDILESSGLPLSVHNRTIQKAIESFRISDQQKRKLRTLRRKK